MNNYILLLQEIEAHFSKKSSFNLLSKKDSRNLQRSTINKQSNIAVPSINSNYINKAFEIEKDNITTHL